MALSPSGSHRYGNAKAPDVVQRLQQDYEDTIRAMESEKERWMKTPAPLRGEIVRQIGEAMRKKKEALG